MSDDLVEIKARVLGAISDYSELSPEQGETWESWFHAAFDMASDKVGDLLDDELATLREALAENERLRAELAEARAQCAAAHRTIVSQREILDRIESERDSFEDQLTAARAELAGLKDVGDEALVMIAANAYVKTRNSCALEGMREAVSAIAQSLIARGVEKERERAANALPSDEKLAIFMVDGAAELANGDVKWGELGDFAQKEWIKKGYIIRHVCLRAIRAGAAP